MNFYMTSNSGKISRIYAKISLKLKLTFIILFSFIVQASATSSFAQITLNEKAVPLELIIKKISSQTGYDFFFNAHMLSLTKPITLNVKNASIEDVLKLCFANQPLTYKLAEKTIVLQYVTIPPKANKEKDIVVTGKVIDETGKPIVGATVKIRSNGEAAKESKGISTDKNGEFNIVAQSENDVLVISYIGYVTQTIKVNQAPASIKLVIAEKALEAVIISTGIIERKKESFTGATATFSGEQLKAIGNQNIIQSLKTLDPSFIQLENNALGSNPNVLPNLEIRGKTSIVSASLQDQFSSDPNQPLFILDGFETSLRTIVDLNMNRIASVTILKDAASTALYGLKASNGVVVIETLKPKPGEMRINYVSDLNIEAPDLSGYNMMNSEEKLLFEKLSGRYTAAATDQPQQIYLDKLYADHLAEIRKGVDSYWLNEPLQIGFSQRHSIYADGGDNALRYGVGASYKNLSGAMKGSIREDWGANVDLTYRKGKFNIINKIYISGYKAENSPYGSFSTFVNTNPYYRKLSPGARYLEQAKTNSNTIYNVTNPLYNAALNSFSNSKNLALQNNLQVNLDINKNFAVRSGLQIQKGITTDLDFVSPLNTTFDNASLFEKGSYKNNKVDNFRYSANLMLIYAKVFNLKHSLTTNLRGEIANSESRATSFSAVGFPDASNGNPSFAYSYKPDSRPSSASAVSRTNALQFSANYSFDNRYLADVSFSFNGSTAFGSNKKYTPYYAGGIGWNVHNEVFMKEVRWINTLRFTVNTGITGNQNFSSYSSISTYGYDSYINYYGQGVSLNSIGNPNLKWQNSVQTNIGGDIVMLNNKLALNVNLYQKTTDPLVVAIDLPSSTGLSKLPFNVGHLKTKGIEVNLKYSPIYKPADRIVWTLGITSAMYNSTYGGFNNTLASLNKAQQNSNSLIRYKDGSSPNDLWAVPSLGIDPATGQEVFLKTDGQYTFTYSTADIVKVGNGTPAAEGVISSNFSYKGFSFGVNLRYVLNRDIFNTALFNKVENITSLGLANNQDKRALYDRWKNPGDLAQFKAISLTNTTQISSRFVQTENTITGESIRFGYRFEEGKQWFKKVGLSSLNLNAYMNDILRFSSILNERGTAYPFTRSVSFSLSAGF